MRNTVASFFILLTVTIGISSAVTASTAIITEVRNGKGSIEIRRAAGRNWEAAAPLQSLNPGDTLRASKDAYAVIIFAEGSVFAKVSSANSPYEIRPGTPSGSKSQKTRTLIGGVADFLSGKKRDILSAPLAVRSLARPPAIISPKDTKLLSAQPSFIWIGAPRVPYTLRLIHENTVVWEKSKIYKTKLLYPADAKKLTPGLRYVLEIETAGHPPVRSWFDIAPEAERRAILEEAGSLEGTGYGDLPKSTVAVLKYGLFVSRGFSADGRDILAEALANFPDEPVLHILMEDYYDSIGIKDLAAEEYDEAHFLLSRPEE